ncbi:hypothetical protein [Rubripirellula reticaptiva]|uniref:Uncharacterized protein n=1 Tax=Rubripirellula reticaptiva TaxID=2528013 RepID=A0A5C6FAS4_9BACT|nr:hypothetical protein [Rubripirellula reticaptiva]TWU57640.1 hypothetical protein Poly59_05470 [Rubripirellula reticaptiva]
MFCVHCGADGAAKFCSACGKNQSPASLSGDPGGIFSSDDQLLVENEIVEAVLVDESADWTNSIHYQTVLDHPVARARIAASAKIAKPGVTGEDLLEVFDAVSPIGFSLGKFTKAILPIYDKLGIKMDRQTQGVFDTSPGRLMLAVLCTIASKAWVIDEVHQSIDQCSLSTELPSGLITNRGRLHVLIEACDGYCRITFNATISGQLYDWGKSNRLMSDMFSDICADLTDQQSGQRPQYRRIA